MVDKTIYVDCAYNSNERMSHVTDVDYEFMEKLKKNVDDTDIPLETRVEICIYKINQMDESLPFLEFLLYLQGNENELNGKKLILPFFLSKHSKSGLVNQASVFLNALFERTSNVKYNGYFYDKSKKRCILFFNKYYEKSQLVFSKSSERWHWVLTSEIFNEEKTLNLNISEEVVSFFHDNPEISMLKHQGKILESPSALYVGKHLNYVSYMASFGLKKASTRAHFGPYYYFVDFIGAMRHACYSMGFDKHILNNGTVLTQNEYGKHTKGGIMRLAVFLGRYRIFLMNGEKDHSDLSMYWANQDPFIKNKLALRDINGNWSKKFQSVYVGEYDINIDEKIKKRLPNWTIKNYDYQIPLSIYKINLKTVPDQYNPLFKQYELE